MAYEKYFHKLAADIGRADAHTSTNRTDIEDPNAGVLQSILSTVTLGLIDEPTRPMTDDEKTIYDSNRNDELNRIGK